MNRLPLISSLSIVLLVGVLLVAGLAGCDDDDAIVEPPVDDGYLPDSSAANVMTNLIKAYQERRADKYAERFDGAEFRFEFSARDRAENPQLPITWPMSSELLSAQNIEADTSVDKVVLRFTRTPLVAATPDDYLPDGPAGIWKLPLQNVHLEVHTLWEGEPLEYLIDNDGADFFFREYPNELVAGRPRWKIVYWRDKPAGGVAGRGVQSTSWGDVKALYNRTIDDGYLPDTSAANVLANLITSYRARQISRYIELLDHDAFRFEFSPVDRAHDPTMPTIWSYGDESLATQHLFNDARASRVLLRFEKTAAVPATADDQLPSGPDGVSKVVLSAVHLEVHTQTPSREPIEYLVNNDGAELYFREYPNELIDGSPRWRIVYWRDKPSGRAVSAVEPKSWGAVKYLYR